MQPSQVIVPSAGLKPTPHRGGPNLAIVRKGDAVLPTPADGWRYVTVNGQSGWLPATAIGPAPPPNPSGIVMPGDVPGWHHIFSDDFTTDIPAGSFPDQVRWGCDVGWNDTSGHGTYDPSILSVSDHCLRMALHATTDVAGKVIFHVAAPFPIVQPKAGQPAGRNWGTGLTYGRYAVCARFPKLSGYKTAWLLWPDNNIRIPVNGVPTARDGEIDFPEANLDAASISGYMHHMNATSGGDQEYRSIACDRTQWHEYAIEWLPTGVTFYLDGAPLGGPCTTRVPSSPMHWKLQTETALSGPLPDPAASGEIEIDWVAVYTPAL